MRETLRLLCGLQELDEDLYRVKDELRRLPQERDRRREKIDHELSRLNELEHRIAEVRTRIKEIEDMTTGQRQRVRKLENEAAKTTDQALIAAYNHEARSIKRDISEAEEEGLGLVETADKLQREADELRAKIEALEEEFRAYSENVDEEIRVAEAKRIDLEAERNQRMHSQVAPNVLETYEKLLDAREGHAMAMLEGRVCQGCYVTVPNNLYVRLARGTELVNCPSCRRILYLPETD
ncbi:MAG TPA: hypothetical protein ENJ09_00645 [Planctomycetes bacterium]|nr:hypothetical protein [Planctomycetota bacterium]